MADEIKTQTAEAPEPESQAKKPVSFTAEQQEVINNLINAKYREAYEKAESKYKEAQEKAPKAEPKQEAAPKTKDKPKDVDQELKSLQDKLAEAQKVIELNDLQQKMLQEKQKELLGNLEKEKQERMLERKRNTLLSAANKAGFIDPTIVQRLVEDSFSYDENSRAWKIHNESGQERWNKNLQPMSIEEFFEEYAEKHPYLVKGSNTGGTGASEAGSGKAKRVWKVSEISKLSPADYEKHRGDIVLAQKEGRISP